MATLNQSAIPWRWPAYRMLAIIGALGASYLTFKIWYADQPVRAFYLGQYARLSFTPDLHKPMQFTLGNPLNLPSPAFDVLMVGSAVATSASFPYLQGEQTVREYPMNRTAFKSWLKEQIYEGKTVSEALQTPLRLCGLYFAMFFVVGYVMDFRGVQRARRGLTLRGPGIVTRHKFNSKTCGDGIRFRLNNRRDLHEFFMPDDSGFDLAIPRNREAHHFLVCGGTGSGKSTLLSQMIVQIMARGERFIVFDPDREYIKKYWRKGDYCMNPLDTRWCYWALESEAENEAEATSIALAFFPDEPNQQPFFKKHPRDMFAYLITQFNQYNCPDDPATCESLPRWLANPQLEITPRLAGTRHAVSTNAAAAPQAQGLWSSLAEVSKPLAMCPPYDPDDPRIFTVRKWAKERDGNIFLTSTPDTIDALRPLHSALLDMLILKLQLESQSKTRVWLIIDELAALNQLPQLESAMTRNRKHDNPIVLGYQGMSQLIKAYGKETAETILSMPFTNITLRVKEPTASAHQSKAIGDVQIERLRESQPSRMFERRNGSYSTERPIEPLIMASELQGLEDLTGYLVQGNMIVPITFDPVPAIQVAEGFTPRPKVEVGDYDFEPEVPTVSEKLATTAKEILIQEGAFRS